MAKINAPQAWDITQGSSTVKVGIIDTGIDSHTDLYANLLTGWNFVNNNNNTIDTHSNPIFIGHGTHVAGIVGAVGNNGMGISGVNWNVKLVPLKITNQDILAPYQGGSSTEVIPAITYAINNSIPIINLSWGGLGNDSALLSAINSYYGLFVCSAGNGAGNPPIGYDIGAIKDYPASWSSAANRIITVGAMNINDAPTTFSNFSSTFVNLFAPGENILSTANVGGVVYWDGTSMAAPFVTGVAALINANYPWLSASVIKTVILRRTTWSQALYGKCSTGGMLNAYQSLAQTQMCVSQKNTCDMTYDPLPYIAACTDQCAADGLLCGGHAVPQCSEWYFSCVSQCEIDAYAYCDDQFLNCIGT